MTWDWTYFTVCETWYFWLGLKRFELLYGGLLVGSGMSGTGTENYWLGLERLEVGERTSGWDYKHWRWNVGLLCGILKTCGKRRTSGWV